MDIYQHQVPGPNHSARAVAITLPVGNLAHTANLGSEGLLAYFARVSNAANQLNIATGPRLIKRLIADAEWSPLDMVNVVFEIETSRAIARQILRHWSARFQEFSQRWAAVDAEPYMTIARAAVPGRRAETQRMTADQEAAWYGEQIRTWRVAHSRYKAAIEAGQHPESARCILPEGMAPSFLYANATLRTWLHYAQLRMKKNTQLEHRWIAEQVWEHLIFHYPVLGEV